MAEEVKETREDFEAQLEESLNKASTNEDAVWNRLEQMKEDGDVLALTVGGVVNGGVIVYVEGIRGFIPASLLSTKYVSSSNSLKLSSIFFPSTLTICAVLFSSIPPHVSTSSCSP